MTVLVPCPGCGVVKSADEGHHLCRQCEGYPAHEPAGLAEQGFAAGYDQGWNDAKAGRPYGTTPACGQPPSNAPVKATVSASSVQVPE